MTELLSASSAITATLGTGLAAVVWVFLRHRISFDWVPGSGVDGNWISALEVALTRRDQAERSLRLYVYVASRKPAASRAAASAAEPPPRELAEAPTNPVPPRTRDLGGSPAPVPPLARDLNRPVGAGSPGSD